MPFFKIIYCPLSWGKMRIFSFVSSNSLNFNWSVSVIFLAYRMSIIESSWNHFHCRNIYLDQKKCLLRQKIKIKWKFSCLISRKKKETEIYWWISCTNCIINCFWKLHWSVNTFFGLYTFHVESGIEFVMELLFWWPELLELFSNCTITLLIR